MRVADTIAEAARYRLSQSSDGPLHDRLERERGLRTFLTWAFFLAQVAAAEELVTGAARAQDDLSDNSQNPSDNPPDVPPDQIDPAKIGGDAPELVTASPQHSGLLPLSSLGDSDPAAAHPHLSSFGSPSTPHSGAAGGAGAGGGAAHARIGSSGGFDHGLPGHGLVDKVASPIVQADVDLHPILGFDLNLDIGGLISANIDLDLGNLLVKPLEAVAGVVDTVVGDVGNLLNQTGLALGEILGLGDAHDSDRSNLSELTGLNLTSDLGGLLDRVGGLLDGGGTDAPERADASQPSGEPAAGASLPQIDELFSGGRYTEYNIALRDGREHVADQPAVIAPSTPDAPHPDAPHSEPPAQADHHDHPPSHPVIAELSPFDEFVTRPAV